MSQYRQRINTKFSQNLNDSHALHAWSVQNPHTFWIDLYDYCGIIPALPKHTKLAYNPDVKLRDIPTFFPGLKINYAENVLVPNTRRHPHNIALVGVREGRLHDPENVSWSELTELGSPHPLSNGPPRESEQGDVIAALMANSIWIIVLFLASASIGAIFTSVAPDLGVSGCVSRFSQVEPKWLFADTDLALRGARPSMLGKVLQILKSLPAGNSKAQDCLCPDMSCTSLGAQPRIHPAHQQRHFLTHLPFEVAAQRLIDVHASPNGPSPRHSLLLWHNWGTKMHPLPTH